jgi:hypothetical protein
MTVHPVTLNLPDTVYEQIQRAATKKRRSVNDLLIEAVTAAAPAMEIASENLHSALAQMAYLNDAALWQAARATMKPEQQERLETLHDKQQREGLTSEEEYEEAALLKLYRETILVRAQAVVLLKLRNYDVSDLTQFQPL